MADFALILAAIDQLRGTDGLTRFAEQARTMAEDSLSSEPFIAAMDEAQVEFEGTAAELLTKVTPDLDRWRPPKGWPKDPRAVTSLLKRNAPALRKAGWIVEDEEGAHRFTSGPLLILRRFVFHITLIVLLTDPQRPRRRTLPHPRTGTASTPALADGKPAPTRTASCSTLAWLAMRGRRHDHDTGARQRSERPVDRGL